MIEADLRKQTINLIARRFFHAGEADHGKNPRKYPLVRRKHNGVAYFLVPGREGAFGACRRWSLNGPGLQVERISQN